MPGLWQIEQFWKALLGALKTPVKAHALALVLVASQTVWVPSARAASTVKIPVGPDADFALAGRLHRASGKKKAPAVVLMHGCGGWQPPVLDALEDYARFLSSKGIVVLNLDSFGPRGNAGGLVCSSFKRLAAARKYRTQDAFAALRYLQAQPFVDPQNVFLIGQSNGGSVALISAQASTERRFAKNRAGFRGIVALYPWCGATGSLRPTLSSPLLILGGGRDDWVPPRDCTRFSSKGESIDVKVYPNAVHSFDVRIPVQRYNGKLVGFNESAATQARREIMKFISTHSTHRF
ncbi:MAG: dienelactone hydrolase family protein [Paracoccaceae bacterium]